MSVIIKEIYWQEYDTTTQIRSVRADIICDALADLPSGGILDDYKLDIGSRAKVIADGSEWEIQSTGSWVRQPSKLQLDLTGYATTQDLAAIVSDFETDQHRQETEIGVVAALGAKNFLRFTGQTQTLNGLTFTVNSDQTVSLSGTATATTTYQLVDNATANAIQDGSYILTGCPSGGGNNTYDLRWHLYSSGKSAYDQGSGASVNKTGNTTSSNMAIVIRPGVNTDGLVFRPMLRRAEITDSTYVPYAPTNRELYETKAEKTEIHALISNIDSTTTITAYADRLGRGHYTSFISNSSRPSDAPVADNIFVEIYIFSTNTALIRAFPTGTAYVNQFFQKSKISGTWREWYRFDGVQA